MRSTVIRIIAACTIVAMTGFTATAQDVSKLHYPPLSPLSIPKVEKITLDNGIRLYLLEDKSLPLFHVAAIMNCGAYLEAPEKIGLADVCGEVLRTGGTAKWTGDQLDETLESVGGSVETSIGLLTGSASVNVLSDYRDLGLEILSEVLRRPAFAQDKIDLAKVTRRSGISRRNDDPTSIGRREFRKMIYGPQSVYARHSEYKTISAITREDLVAFQKKYISPENIQMAIWGDYKRADLMAAVKKYFGDWPKGGTPTQKPPKVDYQFVNKVCLAEKGDVNQSNIYIGHIGGLMTDPDYPSLIVMNSILGGSFGSRLFNSVRSREGLAYAVFGVYNANIAYPGMFYNFASTKSGTTIKAIREIIKEIKRIQTDPPTAEEMTLGKDGYLNSFVFNFENKAEVVTRLMSYDYYGLPDDFLMKEKEGVEKVLPTDVTNAARANIHPDGLQILVVGKSADFELPLDSLGMGPTQKIDITIPSAEEKKKLTVTPEKLSKGKELLDKAVVAHGGSAAFAQVKSVAVKGTRTIVTPQGEFTGEVEGITVYPDKSKSVLTIMGFKQVDIRNGQTGWRTDRTGNLAEKSADDVKDSNAGAARNTIALFMGSASSAYDAVYDGSGEVGGKKVEYVAIADKGGDLICRLGFDAATNQLVSKSYTGKSAGGETALEETYADYKTVSGIVMPMNTTTMAGTQKVSTMQISDFVVNGEVPPNAFDKPE